MPEDVIGVRSIPFAAAVAGRWRRTLLCLSCLGLVATLVLLEPAAAQVRGLSYGLGPSVAAVRWDGTVGLQDVRLYGGRFSFGFGQFVGLEGYYLARDGVGTDLAATGLLERTGGLLGARAVAIDNVGADVVLHLASGRVVPFVKGGAGVLRFTPEQSARFGQVNLKVGGGLRLVLADRLRGEVNVEDSRFRIDRYRLAPPLGEGYPQDPQANDLRHALVVAAGVSLLLGGRSGREWTELDRELVERYRAGLSGASVPVEPFLGKLFFHEDLNLADPAVVGVRAGLDLGRYLGFRGYYWRGARSGLEALEPIQSWGAEAEFSLGSGEGAVPYLTVGAGHLDFMEDFVDPAGAPREDRPYVIFGGGLGLGLGRRLRGQLAARDYLFGQEGLEWLSSSDDVFHNWMVSAGLRLSLGGRGGETPPEVAPARSDRNRTRGGEPSPAGRSTTPDTVRRVGSDSVLASAGRVGFHAEQVIVIPIPTEGEIYVRYGAPGGVRIEYAEHGAGAVRTTGGPAPAPAGLPAETPGRDTLRLLGPQEADTVRALVREELRADRLPETDAEVAELEHRILQRIDALLASRVEAELRRQEASRVDTIVVGVAAPPAQRPPGEVVVTPEPAQGVGWRPRNVRVYTGMNLNDPVQGILGIAADVGPITGTSRLHFVPELATGLGGGATSYLVAGNVELPFPTFGYRDHAFFTPFASLGAGILAYDGGEAGRPRQEGVLNFAYGAAVRFEGLLEALEKRELELLVEHQGIDLFDLQRFKIGVQRRF
ncbi:MAG: hypothetical protein HY704_12840 [Gemmatimonadetes bacterium]|nr:hypothetical protein [Gemmatimonadota bacterium]